MADGFDLELRMAVYRHFALTGESPTVGIMCDCLGAADDEITEGYRRLYAKRLLVPAEDFASIRMAPPFSGVPAQHRAVVNGRSYFANCAWDAFGVVSALGGTGDVFSRCEHTLEPLTLHLAPEGPPMSPWVFHCPVPAARWWQDIVFT